MASLVCAGAWPTNSERLYLLAGGAESGWGNNNRDARVSGRIAQSATALARFGTKKAYRTRSSSIGSVCMNDSEISPVASRTQVGHTLFFQKNKLSVFNGEHGEGIKTQAAMIGG